MILRDEIAARLHAIRWTGKRTHISGVDDHIWGDSTTEQNICLREADEVIRLMEWARLNLIELESGKLRPLTLPPEDWKP